MKWGRKQNLQQQCYSSFGFSFSDSFFPRRWISMMKQSLVSKTTQQQGDAMTKHRDKLKHPISEVYPPPPPNPVRVTTVSGHLFFSPTSLGHLITREELPRCSCLSCCGRSEEDQHGSNRNRNAGGRRKECGSFGSGRERPGSNYYSISTDPHNKECGWGLRRSRSERLDKSVAFPGDVDRSRNKVFELKPVQTKNVRIGKDPDPNDPSQARKSVSGKIRRRNTTKIKSPRLTVKKKVGVGEGQTTRRRTMLKSLESFAVVKRSIDPYKDFRDSMFEMILEQKMTRLEELESLLACYLSLNSEEYHDVIVKVFQQVLFDRRNQMRR